MIVSNGYTLAQDTRNNRIIITLPQTTETITNTVEPISYRKTHLSEGEETVVLELVKRLLESD